MEHPKNGRKFSVAVGKYLDELASPSPSPAPPPSPPSSPSPVPIQQEEPARLLHSDTHIEQPSLLPALADTPPIPSEAPRSAGCKRSYQGTSAIASARAAVEQQLLQVCRPYLTPPQLLFLTSHPVVLMSRSLDCGSARSS